MHAPAPFPTPSFPPSLPPVLQTYLDTLLLELLRHRHDPIDGAGHGADVVVLVPVVDAYVRVGGPHQHRINAVVTGAEVVQVLVDRVLLRVRVPKEAVVGHHLGLYVGVLGPQQLRNLEKSGKKPQVVWRNTHTHTHTHTHKEIMK